MKGDASGRKHGCQGEPSPPRPSSPLPPSHITGKGGRKQPRELVVLVRLLSVRVRPAGSQPVRRRAIGALPHGDLNERRFRQPLGKTREEPGGNPLGGRAQGV